MMSSTGSCPVMSGKVDPSMMAGGCPVLNKSNGATRSAGTTASACGPDDINPKNNMPYELSTAKASGQTIDLPTEKTQSTIPRGDDDADGVWEYPSPQQMFNAMIRKGKGDVPEDAVESMVSIHNFLNEGAWSEILEWEKPYTEKTQVPPRLLKFTGRPDEMSPRARIFTTLGKWFPSKFDTDPPFDRHDWTVLRNDGHGDAKEDWRQVRYVIDYYAGPEEDGMPTFYLDVRPALDNVTNANDRLRHWVDLEARPVWDKAMGRAGKSPESLSNKPNPNAELLEVPQQVLETPQQQPK